MQSNIGKIQSDAMFAAVVAVISAMLTYALQRYRLAELEECYIFVYDLRYIMQNVARPGGAALLLSSLLTQFFVWPAVATVIVAALYGLLTFMLCRIGRLLDAAYWVKGIAVAPVVCLMLCLENNSYNFYGHVAVILSVAALWLYVAYGRRCRLSSRLVCGSLLTVAAYWVAGSASAIYVFGAVLSDICADRRRGYISIVYIALYAAAGYVAYRMQLVFTVKRALTPAMYFEWDTTSYMMLYVWVSAALYLLLSVIFRCASGHRPQSIRPVLMVYAIVVAEIIVGARVYMLVHNTNVYRSMQQRYMAKQGDWDGILAIDYGDTSTPFTSYRLLALAHKDRLVNDLPSTRPYIAYFMKNKTLVKKEDLQVLSDIYYACDYMAAARRYAFDTNIVTPGAFNPYETRRLAEINILTGDYNVAEKYLNQLDHTLLYRGWAKQARAMLYNDAAVDNDPVLGPKRRAIPAQNDYMSPKGTLRDLRYIVKSNPDQRIADQFLQAFIILTRYQEPETDTPGEVQL